MLYIHVPFCLSRCTYCDFYSEQACREEAFERYTAELCAEIDRRRPEIEAALDLNTLYIGGGTPSVLPLSCLERIVKALGYGPYREFTVELNPEDVLERGRPFIEGLLGLGVNRISMGVQSLDDGILRWMNRRHTAAAAREAWRILEDCKSGGTGISVDLITGVPGMNDGMLSATVEEVLEWRPEHISAYQLSIEDGSVLAKMIESGKIEEASEEQCRRQYGLLCSRLSDAGYHHYEISNWAIPGHEAVHNSAYWTRHPYVGLGPAAHSLEIRPDGTQRRSWNSKALSGWKEEGAEILSAAEIREESIMLGLRTDRGVELGGRHLQIPEKDWFIADSLILDLQ